MWSPVSAVHCGRMCKDPAVATELYIRFNQNNLRSDIYNGVLANDGDRAGRRIVGPTTGGTGRDTCSGRYKNEPISA